MASNTLMNFEELPQFQHFQNGYRPFNLEESLPFVHNYASDLFYHPNNKGPAIFSTRGGKYRSRAAPNFVSLDYVTGGVPHGRSLASVMDLAQRFRRDFRLDCQAINTQSWMKLGYYFDDLDIHYRKFLP